LTLQPQALIFDVFGTLVDWRSAISRQITAAFARKSRPVDGLAFADAWRAQYQPSMAPVRDGTRPYAPLDDLHLETLQIVLPTFDATGLFDASERREMARFWEHLDPWPDVSNGLRLLRQDAILAPCSNGSIALISRLARHADLGFDCILGADTARNFKPHPSVYLSSCTALGLPPDAVMMVAAHNDDLSAAARLGLQTAFVPRNSEFGPHQTTDLIPSGDWTITANDLTDLAQSLTHMNKFR